jgi:diguanylate cyclase (GGDEF)-like protein
MIDIKTFMLVLGIGNIGFAMLIAGYARGGKDSAAIRLWKWSKLVQGLAHLLGWARPDLPWPLVGIAGNGALLAGIALEVAAYCVLFGFMRWTRLLYGFAALSIVLVCAARLVGGPPNELTALMSFAIAVLTGAMALILLRPGANGSLLQKIVGAGDAVFFAAMLLRGWSAMSDSTLTPLSATAVQTFAYLTGYLLMIVNGFGFLLLYKERDDRTMALLATIDSLTGLVNRRAFFERTARARQFAGRVGKPVALMMLDIDHFKRLNDRFGHACGDEALCAFAATAQATLREHDILGRLGGEEFALVMPGTDLAGACYAAERLRAAVEGAVLACEESSYALTVSIGVVLVDPQEHINAALARADRALYQAKSAGRNRVEVGEEMRRCA